MKRKKIIVVHGSCPSDMYVGSRFKRFDYPENNRTPQQQTRFVSNLLQSESRTVVVVTSSLFVVSGLHIIELREPTVQVEHYENNKRIACLDSSLFSHYKRLVDEINANLLI